MSRLTDLIARAKAKDSQLGADLEKEFRALSSTHLPNPAAALLGLPGAAPA